jgi:glycosyltransferase involved in cell wall biosynthesis
MAELPTVHLVHFYSSPGGIELLSSRLLPSFSGYTFRVFVVRPVTEGQVNVYEGADVPVCYGSRNNLHAMFRLWRYARRHRDEIFHLFNLGPFFLMCVKLAGARHIIYSIHGTKYWKNPWQRALRKPLWKWAIGKSIKVTSNSEYSRRVFTELVYRDARVQVVYNPISNGRFVPPQDRSSVPGSNPVSSRQGMTNEPGLTKEPGRRNDSGSMKEREIKKIVYVGRLNPGKNLEKWIDVAVDLHGKFKSATFEIYGSGPLFQPLIEKIRSPGAEDFISLKGYRSDIENVFREADLLLFLSEYESFGNVVVESILCGTPVIASDIPSMREIFRDYPLFLVSPDGDLCSQIAERLRDYDSLADQTMKAGLNFRERFSERAYINSLNQIYASCHG